MRPKLVRNALNSVLKANEFYEDWEMAFIDDSSPKPGRAIAESIMKDHLHKVKFYHTSMYLSEKKKTDGMVGRFMNLAMKESNADIGIMLCDDDELHPHYLRDINQYFQDRPEVGYCYSNIQIYLPGWERSENVENISGPWNQYNTPISAADRIDASQVAWRIPLCKEHQAWFAENRTRSLDATIYDALYKVCGPCVYTGMVSQYKGVHPGCLQNLNHRRIWHGKHNIDLGGAPVEVSHIASIIERYRDQNKLSEALRICNQAIAHFENNEIFHQIKGLLVTS